MARLWVLEKRLDALGGPYNFRHVLCRHLGAGSMLEIGIPTFLRRLIA